MPETVEASLQLGATVMRSIGVGCEVLDRLLAAARHDDYAGLYPLIVEDDAPIPSPEPAPGRSGGEE